MTTEHETAKPSGADPGSTERRTIERLPAPEGVAPSPAYTHVVTGTGRLVVLSGQVAQDADGVLVGVGDPEAQARQVFENLWRCLDSAGATFDDVVKLTWFVTDMALMPVFRKVRAAYIADDRLPASTAMQVVALFRPELVLEVEALAIVADGRVERSQSL
jgi:enamine deaminase RidA (YjgF/YER057c/UK114 family)